MMQYTGSIIYFALFVVNIFAFCSLLLTGNKALMFTGSFALLLGEIVLRKTEILRFAQDDSVEDGNNN
jgi:hypothetical protein